MGREGGQWGVPKLQPGVGFYQAEVSDSGRGSVRGCAGEDEEDCPEVNSHSESGCQFDDQQLG